MEICYDLNALPLYTSLIFRKLPEAFLRRLSLDMTHQFYLTGDVIYNENDNMTSMVIIYISSFCLLCVYSKVT